MKLKIADDLSLPLAAVGGKISGVAECIQHPSTPNHRPEIGGLAAMADSHSRRSRPSTKTCVDCGGTFERDDESDKRWDVTRRCLLCRAEELKRRIREGSPADDQGCWIWKGSTRNGYGQISVNDQTTYTHQLSYELFIGPLPAGQQVLHRCDVRRCNNPEHFFAGTQRQNIHDMWEKGRAKKPPVHRGLSNSNATLTDEQVAEIRRLRESGVHQRTVANQFGCSQSTVWRLTHEITRAIR